MDPITNDKKIIFLLFRREHRDIEVLRQLKKFREHRLNISQSTSKVKLSVQTFRAKSVLIGKP
jgi:hypothetical protein